MTINENSWRISRITFMVSLLRVTNRTIIRDIIALLKAATTACKTCTYLLCNCDGAINRASRITLVTLFAFIFYQPSL